MKKTQEKTKREMTVGLGAAVEEAYLIVVEGMKITHEQLCGRFDREGVNNHTLNRIRDGKPRKMDTNWRYLRIFMTLIEKDLQRRRNDGYDGASTILGFMRKIFLLQLCLPTGE